MSVRSHRLLLVTVLGIYLALALSYGVVTPLFEAPDEHLHYFTAKFIAREGRLPTTLNPGLMGQEAAQPPLYYILASAAVRIADAAGPDEQLWLNPKADPADPRGESLARPPINVNLFIHGPAEAWPWHGYALAAHLMRLLSAAFGLGTLLCIYGAGRTVWPANPDRALLATGLIAFLPQFAFVHAVVTNDAAITFFSAAALWQLLRLTNGKPGTAARASSASLLLLGLTIGLAMLSKAAGLLLLVFCVAVLAVCAVAGRRHHRRSDLFRVALLVLAPAVLLGGWLLWRNWIFYGDPTAASQFVRLAGGERPYTLRQVWHDMDRVWFSLFAFFGWMNVRPPVWIWLVWSAIAVVAGAGAIRTVSGSFRRRTTAGSPATLLLHPAVILFSWFVLVALAWLQFMLRTPADQGRLFFPALVPMALGTAYGLSRWPRPWTQLAALGLALLTSIYCLVAVIRPAYAQPPVVAAVPAEAAPLSVTLPEGQQLLGISIDTPTVRVGDWAWITLYWRDTGLVELSGAPLAHLELFGRAFERIGLQTGYQGRGTFPVTLWPEDEIIEDRTAIRVEGSADAPVEARLTVKTGEEGTGVEVGRLKVIPAGWPETTAPVAVLGDGIELAAAEVTPASAAPGESVEVRLRWQVTAPPGPALLHVFAHLGDPQLPPLAQFDGPLMAGEYPSRLWEAGEVMEETLVLTLPAELPPGEYPIHVGIYQYDTGNRLPVHIDGARQPADTYTVGRILVP